MEPLDVWVDKVLDAAQDWGDLIEVRDSMMEKLHEEEKMLLALPRDVPEKDLAHRVVYAEDLKRLGMLCILMGTYGVLSESESEGADPDPDG